MGGCKRERPVDRREPAASPELIAKAWGIDAGVSVGAVDPPAPAGDLAREIARFTTVEACVAERGQIDPLLGDALGAIGYETLLTDSCRTLEALKVSNGEACARISALSLRTRCLANVAMAKHEPDACPLDIPNMPDRGRLSTCVAVAARDPRLCVSEPRFGRALCDALAHRDAKRCASLAAADRDACAREVARWYGLLAEPKGSVQPLATRLQVEMEPAGGPAMDPKDLEQPLDLTRGLVVVQTPAGLSLRLGSLERGGSVALWIPPPLGRVRMAMRLLVADAGARVEQFELDIPGRSSLVVPGVFHDLKAQIETLESRRGGLVKVNVAGTVGIAPHVYRVKMDATTFVRDVVNDDGRALH